MVIVIVVVVVVVVVVIVLVGVVDTVVRRMLFIVYFARSPWISDIGFNSCNHLFHPLFFSSSSSSSIICLFVCLFVLLLVGSETNKTDVMRLDETLLMPIAIESIGGLLYRCPQCDVMPHPNFRWNSPFGECGVDYVNYVNYIG